MIYFIKFLLTRTNYNVIIIIVNEREVNKMIATGIIRRIDDLGRIVIPREIRKKLKVSDGDPFEIFMTKEGEVILKPYRVQEYTLRKSENWEELIAPDGKVICGNHRLYATEILDALGIQYSEEELEEDEEED